MTAADTPLSLLLCQSDSHTPSMGRILVGGSSCYSHFIGEVTEA